jgi:hypothetical protein
VPIRGNAKHLLRKIVDILIQATFDNVAASVANNAKPANQSLGVTIFARLTENTPQKGTTQGRLESAWFGFMLAIAKLSRRTFLRSYDNNGLLFSSASIARSNG